MDKWSIVKTYKAVLADKTLECIIISPSAIPGHRNNTKIGNECMYVCTTEAHSCNHCRRGKTISITYCECVFVALGIQHSVSMHMHYIILPSVNCLAPPFFFFFSHK
jgi:hypothetical protein